MGMPTDSKITIAHHGAQHAVFEWQEGQGPDRVNCEIKAELYSDGIGLVRVTLTDGDGKVLAATIPPASMAVLLRVAKVGS